MITAILFGLGVLTTVASAVAHLRYRPHLGYGLLVLSGLTFSGSFVAYGRPWVAILPAVGALASVLFWSLLAASEGDR